MKTTMHAPVFYHRRLPHLQPPEGDFSIVYRLADSLPKTLLQKLEKAHEQNRQHISETHGEQAQARLDMADQVFIRKVDRLLPKIKDGPMWLGKREIAQIVIDSLKYIEMEMKFWTIWSYCVMSNHVHLECTLAPGAPALYRIMQSHKSFTAVKANRLLGRSGSFWMEESYDRVIRNKREFHNRVRYTLRNPVAARLVADWRDWPYTYVHPEVLSELDL
jgi:REP element-mobilizing transposase RayT